MNGLKLDRFLSIIADKSVTIDLCPFILFFIIIENILKREERKNKNWNISENIFYDYYDIYITQNVWKFLKRFKYLNAANSNLLFWFSDSVFQVEINVFREFLSRNKKRKKKKEDCDFQNQSKRIEKENGNRNKKKTKRILNLPFSSRVYLNWLRPV